ncbi:thiosulfate/3-mercaptopyruvate sulfurtransferase [Kaistia hirudinis]|uniref:Thiosulfate/3-mercaptopyruvate sulfurtransferase n=1 Tax=Kaistia hirudinis TaxID=1293440 RepID=A0A840AUE6_9HYPH|nr:sulfurtransferase [Kaistia hirudinis]MBB3932075.1 thiosulfate/3-mercaptopyruvate sulfurtransferase [Kaistia hirudinis]
MHLPPIVSAQWLAEHLDDPDLSIFDASVEKIVQPDGTRVWRPAVDAFVAGHVPGARFADLAQAFSDPEAPFSFTRPSAERFSDAAGQLGLTGQERVVLYDGSTGIWAARLWWLFRAFGHENVAVLDGGLTGWKAAGHALEAGLPEPVAPGWFPVRAERPGAFVDAGEVEAIVAGERSGVLACVLRPPVFAGTEHNYARPGHIPGSLNLPYGQLVDAENRFRPEGELRATLAPLLQSPDPVIVYCGGGITAAGTALLLTTLGAQNVAIYDGSLEEWTADNRRPMAVIETTST